MADHIDGDKLQIEWDGVERRVDNRTKLFGISLANAIQIIVFAVGGGVIMLSMRQDMAQMKASMESNNVAHHEIMMKLVEVQTHIVSMQADLIYNRDRLDEAILDRAKIAKQPNKKE